jgi:hypothetical protein
LPPIAGPFPTIRARFDEAVTRLHGEAVTLVAEVVANLNGSDRTDPDTPGDVGGQAAIDALCGTR